MATKTATKAKVKSKPKEKFTPPAKPLDNVVTDATIAADAALTDEQTLAEKLKEAQEVEGTPDRPSMLPKRWGESRRLTFATPGTMQRDPFYIPEFVETTDGRIKRRVSYHQYINGQLHILTRDGRSKFRWTSLGKIDIQRRYGFRFENYDVLFGGTQMFEKRGGSQIWNGDVVLMSIGLDHWEKKVRETREIQNMMEGSYGSDFFHKAQSVGAPSFQDDVDRGVREYMT